MDKDQLTFTENVTDMQILSVKVKIQWFTLSLTYNLMGV